MMARALRLLSTYGFARDVAVDEDVDDHYDVDGNVYDYDDGVECDYGAVCSDDFDACLWFDTLVP